MLASQTSPADDTAYMYDPARARARAATAPPRRRAAAPPRP
jgi:hypothetical protein